MSIAYFGKKTELPNIDQERTSQWIIRIIMNHNCEIGEINYYFCTDDDLLKMNRKHLNHNYYTDIITFDYTVGRIVSGDLFISLDTVKDNAKTYSCEYLEEIYRVMIHGVLHLLGFKDGSDEEKKMMTQKEDECLNWLLEL